MKNKEWWQKRYNEGFFAYFLSHAKYSDLKVTNKETDMLLKLIPEKILDKKRLRILDLGGGYGRHAINLAQKCNAKVSVFDQSEVFIEIGRLLATNLRLENRVSFSTGDARKLSTHFNENSFDVVVCLGNSIFGYFDNTKHDKLVLKQVLSILKNNGVFILDTKNSEFLQKLYKYVKVDKTVAGNFTIATKRRVKDNKIFVSEKVSRKKTNFSETNFYMHLYSDKQIIDMFKNVGFSSYHNHTMFGALGNKGTMSNRKIFIGFK